MVGFVVRAVVGREHHQGVFGNAQLTQFVEQSPDIAVHVGDHRCLPLVRARPVPAGIDPVIGNLRTVTRAARALVVGMRNRERQVHEERRVSAILQPGHRLAHDHVVGVLVPLRRPASSKSAIGA